MVTSFTMIHRMGRSRVIITASGGMRGSKRVDLKKIVDAAAKVALDKGHKARHAQVSPGQKHHAHFQACPKGSMGIRPTAAVL